MKKRIKEAKDADEKRIKEEEEAKRIKETETLQTGQEYFDFIKEKYNKLNEPRIDYLDKLAEFYIYLHKRSQIKSIDDGNYIYSTISRRPKDNAQSCNVEDFVFNREQWEDLKKIGTLNNKDIFNNIDSVVQKELDCFNFSNRFKNNLSNFKNTVANKFKSTPQAGPQAGPPAGKDFFGKMFGNKGGRTKKRNSNRKKTKRAKRSKKSKK